MHAAAATCMHAHAKKRATTACEKKNLETCVGTFFLKLALLAQSLGF